MAAVSVDIDAAVFNAVYRRHLDNMARVQVFYGGASSGKSVFLAQRVVYDLLNGGRNYLIARAVARTIRGSVFAEILKVVRQWGLTELFDVNQSDRRITCHNGYQAMFVGLDDTEKLKSITPERGAITDVWVEEATEAQEDDIRQLLRRQRGGDPAIPKRLTLSFNPVLRTSWIYGRYFAPVGWMDDQMAHPPPGEQDDGLTILKTTYLDNRFLSADDRALLEDETDTYWRDVYTLGNWGVLGDVIFTNWRVDDLSGMASQWTNRRAGLDFGFASDPAALVLTHYDPARQTIYVYGELYERGLTNDVLAAEIGPVLGGDYVVCDSAEPKSIAEIKALGVRAGGAVKGKDSVTFGVQWLQRQTIVVDRRCVNMTNELQAYQWRKDKDGNSIRQPVARNDHLIDALRYAYESEMDPDNVPGTGYGIRRRR